MGSTPLPVLAAPPTAGPDDLVRRFHRARHQQARILGDETVVDGGTWIHNPDLQPLPDANCVLDAAVDPGSTAVELVTVVAHLSANCPVRAWTLNPSLPADRTQPLADHLAHHGWVPHVWDVLHLPRLITATIAAVGGVTVIPARAAYGPLRQLWDGRFGDARVDAALMSLDDPHLDGWVALRNGNAVAAVSMLNDGETGIVTDLYVSPGERRQGLGRMMLGRALEASGRSGHRHVLAGVRSGEAGLFPVVGFRPVGRWVRFERA
jgi:GNAT superfamily N-acetyltransferase